jgi:putative endonuclease
VYYESYSSVKDAIAREKEIKKWTRKRKDRLISEFNPGWSTLNDDLLEG